MPAARPEHGPAQENCGGMMDKGDPPLWGMRDIPQELSLLRRLFG